ncbi:hypothetical protein [Gudongella sp. DL1XJH-153]|uniref:hypothetical protein n=1 Tax=Gudongella sp. DL1XJH-153 TaxID=3409804 RepID=UPI003BB64FFB
MNGKKVKYIAYYNDDKINPRENRNTFLAIKNKVDYICRALNRNGYEVEIVSPCWSNNDTGYYKGRISRINEGVLLRNFFTIGSKGKTMKKIKQILSSIFLLKYLLFGIKKEDIVIVYHSISLIWPITIAKYIKKFDIILEVEEIYSDVWKGSANYEQEVKYIKKFEKYLFASDKLSVLFAEKPSVVIYGAYEAINVEKKENNFNDEINLVYAGSIDRVKGGAFNAIKSMRYLPNRYHLNILGFGEKTHIDEMIDLIEKLNLEMNRECCSFHGILVGDEYKKFMLNCDIGLNPQVQGEYMNSAFPSKVLSYLSHHLNVVSTAIESITISKVANQINFSADDTPSSIAKAVMTVELDKAHSQLSVIETLDYEFVKDLNSLLKSSNLEASNY